MFALGFYDSETRGLLLARDMFGEKPLYYVDCAEYFAFRASELHALTLLPSVFDARIDSGYDRDLSVAAIRAGPGDDLFGRAEIAAGLVSALASGHGARGRALFPPSARPASNAARGCSSDLADELEDILVRSLRRRLIADVPLGAFLSGGVDSSTVAALITRRLNRSLQTFSIGFEGHADSEHLDAREMARHIGTDHHEQIVSPDMLDLGDHIGRVLDEPNGDSSCLPTWLLSRFARGSVTVALSGDGGDELFGGYGRYFATVDDQARAGAGWSPGSTYLSSRILVYPDAELQALTGGMPAGLGGRLSAWRGAIDRDRRPLINVLRETDAATYLPGAVLPKVDRMSMQHSLEVRAPLLGVEVANFAAGLAADDCYAAGQGKLVLKRVAERYIPAEWLARPKRGFGLPMDRWGAKELLPIAQERLLAPGGQVGALDRPGAITAVSRAGSGSTTMPIGSGRCTCWKVNWLGTHAADVAGA